MRTRKTPIGILSLTLAVLALAAQVRAAELATTIPPPDLDKLVGQPVDVAPWAYAWRADRAVQEKPEAWFIPRRLERLDKVYRPVVKTPEFNRERKTEFPMLAPPKGGLMSALLWLAPVKSQRIELNWPTGSPVPPIDALEVRVYPAAIGWFGFVSDQALAPPQVSVDGRTLTYLNEQEDPQAKKTKRQFGSTDMVAVFFDPS